MVAIRSRNELLEAYLASCIGVTLCDRKAKVGGLIHLLLPEPTGEGTPWNPLAYAKTGMPLFIQALCELGASIENMEACVSGGALVGPVNDMDINLDIGGRTAEVVHSILRSEGISIVQSETGGCFCCKLSLDLMTFEASINPVIDMPGQEDENFQKPDSDSIADSIQGVRPIPQIALKIARMTESDDYDISGISKEIRQDQVLSAKIIALSNSSFMGQTKRVDSIERALIISGGKMLFQMVLSASLELYFHDVLRG
jgi:chemotaxis receptor (MCP) glutamine deamidase CheD